MKQYQKAYEDHFKDSRVVHLEHAGSHIGTADELAERFRKLAIQAHRQIFDAYVRYAWLECQFKYRDKRRKMHRGNGHALDATYGRFHVQKVGISQKVITMNNVYTVVISYLKDFFPDFLEHDPDKEPEYFAYPYKHVTLDFLMLVYLFHDRLWVLDYAEENKLNYRDFVNWFMNQVKCYNDELGYEMYEIKSMAYMLPVISPKTEKNTDNYKLFQDAINFTP